MEEEEQQQQQQQPRQHSTANTFHCLHKDTERNEAVPQANLQDLAHQNNDHDNTTPIQQTPKAPNGSGLKRKRGERSTPSRYRGG
mmetsp:Transcript_8053/g.11773  ORF Transcript_8053/g.11773 Transcript_8053/m.11773 type:complete len:85 (+) Transcript_8053:178-432(+)